MFTHLHVHTEYSLLDGLSRIPQLLDRAKELGQGAIAITDHGVLYGAIDFYKEARARGLNPIIGQEAYVAAGSRHSRDAVDKSPYHLTLLARDTTGYKNLLALTTKAHLEGYYYRPRMDRELFQQHHEGLIVLSGCPSSEIHRALQEGRWSDAVKAALWYREVFGQLYIEVQEHGQPEFAAVTPKLVELARELDLPLVLTNDSHYTVPAEADVHEVLLCIGTNTTIKDPNRLRMEGGSFYLKSEEEMRALFPDLPEAADNTTRIAEECAVEIEFGRPHLPDPELPPGVSPDEHLASLCWRGMEGRYPPAAAREGAPDPVRTRLEYELDVIRETGFANYILLIKDVADFARSRGILMGVRGSAAASVALYCLGITEVDPLEHRLVFERFLNRERREMPDVDLDFADDRRDEVIRYVAGRYGHERVAQIITFGTLGAKAAIRDVGRALGMTYSDVDRVARLVPGALHMTIDRALDESPELAAIYQADDQVRRLVDTARQLEGVARHASTHAAGVVISREPLVEHLPLQAPIRAGSAARDTTEDAIPMTQYAMNQVAEIGLLKMDFLGLANLTILGRAVELIRQGQGVEIDLHRIPDQDPETYAMLAAGETFGVFQLESAGMRRAVIELRPESVAELAALVALYRPGPMQHIQAYCDAKHGRAEMRYPHPDLAEVLDETYGVIVYQDQVLLIAQQFAGYTLGEADIMRKAMGKKVRAIMEQERERFLAGAQAKGYSPAAARKVFDLIEPFAGYAFNKAHAVCYATIAYQTAYLKAHYPAEYMTALLRLAGHDRIAPAIAECHRLGIPVLPPDVNRSDAEFAIETDEAGQRGIRFGLAVIKNVGHGAAEAVVAVREANGPFTSAEDFCRRLPLRTLNKRALESMVKAGALDPLADRGTLLHNLDRLLTLAQREHRLRETGQATMFDLLGDRVATPLPTLHLEEAPVPLQEQLAWEKELLGVYVSEHPFRRAAGPLGPHTTALCAEVSPEMAGREVTLAGMVTDVLRRTTRNGRPFAVVELEDLSGSQELTVWQDTLELTAEWWRPGAILLVQVRVRSRNERLQLSVVRAAPFDPDTGQLAGYDEGEWGRPGRPTGTENRTNGSRNRTLEGASSGLAPGADPPRDPPEGTTTGRADGNPTPSPSSISENTRPDDGSGPDEPPGITAAPASPPREQTPGPAGLRIVLHETADEEMDRERLQRVVGALRRFPGEVEVRLTIHQADGQLVELSLGTCRPCPEITQHLAGLTGVQVMGG